MNQRNANVNSDASNTLIIPTPKRLCIRIPLPSYVEPPVQYELNHEGTLYNGSLDKNGEIDIELEQSSGEASFKVWPYGKEADPVEWQLSLGMLPDIETLQGVQARLNSLGFKAGPVDGLMGKQTRTALVGFQQKHNLETNGKADQKTKAALVDAYGS